MDFSKNIIKKTIKILIFIIVFGVSTIFLGIQSNISPARQLIGEIDIFLNNSSSQLSLTDEEISTDNNKLKRYISGNLKEIKQIFTNDLWK